MEQTPLTLAYLESLSTADLVALAEDFGIDIPEGLNRRFILGELLELAEYDSRDMSDSGVLIDASYTTPADALPDTYNETAISMLLRDPGWLFVYWDFHANLFSAITSNYRFESFFLRVNALSSVSPVVVKDWFDVNVGSGDRQWYVHLPANERAVRVDLYSRNTQEKEQLLAKSAVLSIPVSANAFTPAGERRRLPPLVELSGITELRKQHFNNHRQSFG